MSLHKLQNEHIKEIKKIKNKNEPNFLIKFVFLFVNFDENVANGLATKWSLILYFRGCEGCWRVWM